uniref:Gamma-glutamyltransferase n=1 Tax=Arion vulgaris TaxID=1028688 RepID=A0A0B7ANE3_9EUPU
MNQSLQLDHDIQDQHKRCRIYQVPRLVLVVLIIVLLAAFVAALLLLLSIERKTEQAGRCVATDSDKEAVYRYASVASSTMVCSQVGTDILAKKGGTAVDAAIATLVCVGLVRFHSSGIGGDSFWTIYDRKSKKAYTILARSKAPLNSTSTMFENNTIAIREGGLSVAVPGEVMALWEAHQRFGQLPWSDLFQPTISLAENGFPLEATTANAIQSKVADGTIDKFPHLRNLLINPATNTWYKTGETVRNPTLANTLRIIASEGAAGFYNGSLTKDMVKELNRAGGIITEEDFAEYHAPFTEPLHLRLHGNLTVYSPPLPSGGVVMLYILNILSGYNLSQEDLSNHNKTVLTYHRHLEAFKHAYAIRSKLGSPDGETPEFVQKMEQLVRNVTSSEQGEIIRRLISDTSTYPWQSYNADFYIQEDNGTSQLSVLGPNGDAVSVTSTINSFFGSKVVGNKTGIIYNNMMDDFSIPGVTNSFGVKPSTSNYIKAGKRPLSSMSPTIVVDKTGTPVLVVGAAGGTRITTTTAFLTSMTLWLGKRMKPAMDTPRIHHQLLPNEAVVSNNAPDWLLDGLKKKGHKVKLTSSMSTPTGILQLEPGKIFADAPGFIVDGF